jgi:predicted RNase H-like HicB family nuclease
MTYSTIFERATDGTIWGYCPDLPGATGAGETLDEAKASLREGVRLWIEVHEEEGWPIPAPSLVAIDTIEVVAT